MPIFLYKTTNLINGKFYYGVHTGPLVETLGKLYLGSGIALKAALRKYGKENFAREIIEVFDDYESAYAREAEIVTDILVKDSNCYNLRPGGIGGFTPEAIAKIAEMNRGRKCTIRGPKISASLKGVKKTEAHRAALRKPKIMIKKQCPHCKIIGSGANMTRYHFDKCRANHEA